MTDDPKGIDVKSETAAQTAPAIFVALLKTTIEHGSEVTVAGKRTRELLQHKCTIREPACRVSVIPERRNSIFAALAETAWVLGGRDDIAFLEPYLPRASDYSDNGLTWRAAYGPRLRNWNGVDQLGEVVKLLLEDPNTRRAAAMIFDPDRDFVISKDIPCANWLHFIERDQRLHLSVGTRSNDLIWGFSGINVFEWSVIQEIVANSLPRVSLGELVFFIGSLHVYDYHFERARAIIESHNGGDIYTLGVLPTRTSLHLKNLDLSLDVFFKTEEAIRRGCWEAALQTPTGDPLLDAGLCLLGAFHAAKADNGDPAVKRCLLAMPNSDLRVAAVEYLKRVFACESLIELLPPDVQVFLAGR